MERQITVRLPEGLSAKLERAARRAGRKRSALVRRALEQFLGSPEMRIYTRPVDLVRDLLGAFESGLPDLGQHHREYLLDRLRHAK